ncbi:GTPase [Catenibacterium sp.]|uniref:GTPase n=1 Tax=Catenibacterium sp. TaxID=2049022 RepID=UPI00399AD8F1
MLDENQKIEKRLAHMKNFYLKIEDILDSLPDVIPENTKDLLKNKILGDNSLKNLMDGIDSHRPPRIFLIGRTGVGKSSLINALCGAYVAKVSDTRSCTIGAEIYQCKENNRVLMEILDTRGIAESESLDNKISAEELLVKQINEFSPDVAIMMLNCTHRDDIITDVEFMKKVSKDYEKTNSLKLPIVVVVNKCDEMAPSRFKLASEYPKNKIDKINEVVLYYKDIIVKNKLKIYDIIPVSSLIDWQTPDGMEVSVEDIDNLPQHDIDNLQIAFDGRYKIEELLDILEEAIQDFEAQMGLRMAARLNDVVVRVAKQLNKIFTGISASVALTPIPTSDIYILLILQSIMVTLIASLSGRDVSIDTAKEFIFSISGVGLVGYGLRLAAQQGSKFINAICPGAGSTVSAAIASVGTNGIGKAAIAYYIEGNSIDDVKTEIKKNQNPKR